MNVPRLALAAIAAWIVSIVLGGVVNSFLLAGIYAEHAQVFRAAGDMNLPLGFTWSLIGFFVFVFTYAKGYEGGNGLVEGMRFGVLAGLLLICFGVIWEYVVFPVSGKLVVFWVLDTLIEFAIFGMVVGFVYKPKPKAAV
jgi:hypothetical protein